MRTVLLLGILILTYQVAYGLGYRRHAADLDAAHCRLAADLAGNDADGESAPEEEP